MLRTMPVALGVLCGCSASHVDSSVEAECRIAEPAGPLSDEEVEGLAARIVHEAGHLTGATLAMGLRLTDGAAEDVALHDANDVGDVNVTGEVSRTGPEVSGGLVADFRSYTGGHGGWGYAALDGRACLAVRSDGETTWVDMDGVLRTAEGPARRGTPWGLVSLRQVIGAGGTRTEGTVGGRDVPLR